MDIAGSIDILFRLAEKMACLFTEKQFGDCIQKRHSNIPIRLMMGILSEASNSANRMKQWWFAE